MARWSAMSMTPAGKSRSCRPPARPESPHAHYGSSAGLVRRPRAWITAGPEVVAVGVARQSAGKSLTAHLAALRVEPATGIQTPTRLWHH